jgi:hypothetical protein
MVGGSAMVVKATSEGLDWLQRIQAAWTATPEAAKQWIRGLVGSAVVAIGAAIAARISNWTPADAYLFSVSLGAISFVAYGLFLRLKPARSHSSGTKGTSPERTYNPQLHIYFTNMLFVPIDGVMHVVAELVVGNAGQPSEATTWAMGIAHPGTGKSWIRWTSSWPQR